MKYIAFFLCLFLSVAMTFGQSAVLKDFMGTVEVRVPGGQWTPASLGMILERNASISTGFKSNAVLGLGNSTITVRPLTRLTLEELINNQGDETVRLNLRTGRVRAEVAPPSGGKTNFTIRSTHATASVRGTEFEFEKDAIYVSSGNVVFADQSGTEVSVRAGESSSASEEGGVSVPAPVETAPESPIQANNEGFAGTSAAVPSGSVSGDIFWPGDAGVPQTGAVKIPGFTW
ncbi:MAG: FecR domain-containing protein [Treponema sp.]|jgi:hypothetical protein|nr:FecR domain-containing protein [Treponema sp.]